MTYSQQASPTTRRAPRLLVTGLLVVTAATTAALGYPMLASSAARAASPIDALRGEHRGAALAIAPDLAYARGLRDRGLALIRGSDHHRQVPGPPPLGPGAPGSSGPGAPGRPPLIDAPGQPGSAPPGVLPARAPAPEGADHRNRPQRGAPAEADGVVPDGTTVFDDEVPGVARLNPGLRSVLRRAATDASDDGVELYITSGWRSPEYQNRLLREAVSEYGSEEEAARWVATADTSPHVSGDAVDIGASDATAWLSRHGARYGLCRIYRNEPWHFELRADATSSGCPPMYADPAHDPRMQP